MACELGAGNPRGMPHACLRACMHGVLGGCTRDRLRPTLQAAAVPCNALVCQVLRGEIRLEVHPHNRRGLRREAGQVQRLRGACGGGGGVGMCGHAHGNTHEPTTGQGGAAGPTGQTVLRATRACSRMQDSGCAPPSLVQTPCRSVLSSPRPTPRPNAPAAPQCPSPSPQLASLSALSHYHRTQACHDDDAHASTPPTRMRTQTHKHTYTHAPPPLFPPPTPLLPAARQPLGLCWRQRLRGGSQ